ncbi:hypothetical protein EBZ35_00340 [bacterium]|nr:hypothetical protein [bacterium]
MPTNTQSPRTMGYHGRHSHGHVYGPFACVCLAIGHAHPICHRQGWPTNRCVYRKFGVGIGHRTIGLSNPSPPWQSPHLIRACRQATRQVLSFVIKAGGTIVVISLGLWGLSTFPSPEHSLMISLSHYLDPIMHVIGADWRVGVGLLASFGARELFGPAVHAVSPGGLRLSWDTSLAILVFYMMALQCGATMAVLKQETKSLRFALGLTALYILLAMVASVLTYQVLHTLRSCF